MQLGHDMPKPGRLPSTLKLRFHFLRDSDPRMSWSTLDPTTLFATLHPGSSLKCLSACLYCLNNFRFFGLTGLTLLV
ncbi:hypothetical protein MPTK1_5g12530 [Marchantia polymorpha subsp. ruderalis]|uniref:Uncharacterized protein n=2 Tax=Marchantia polymorpha TaxID=3197 RepID=A0AAF6BHM4_MARPO|nr:hypothetical protein MARPO_0092s0053 [Marchantia polymorpha]BBN11508.1 hypothetical protein Mp_5g12530 [Marchantia polymorpha subsp. ruderalis]|eukprot:PTQ33092.1 hypothetical protein MARPO_0092s0053 [Marchantia polymorpha]